MEIIILLFAYVALPTFTIVGAMNSPVASTPGKEKLTPSNIPEGSRIFIQKVIDGKDAHNDVVHGKLASFGKNELPSATGTPLGFVRVHLVVEYGHVPGSDSETMFTHLWKIKDFENHGKDGFLASRATTYRCTIEREHGDKLYAFLKPVDYAVRRNAGDAIVMFENQHGVPFVGTLHSGVDPSVKALPPLPELKYAPLKNRKTNFAGSSSNPDKKID